MNSNEQWREGLSAEANAKIDAYLRGERSKAPEKTQDQKRQGVRGFDAYYLLLLEEGFLPGKSTLVPNRVMTKELHVDMLARVPELRHEALNKLGTYFGEERFGALGVTLWRTVKGKV